MKFATYASALFALFLFGNLAIAQDAKPDAKPEEKKAEEKFDRGDEKAEKALKTAYTRIISAEAKGLERFKGDAKIVIDMSSSGLPINVPPQIGTLLWKSGKAPHFEPTGEAEKGPGGMDTSAMTRQAFAPFMSFVFGVEAWDSRFKEANFKFGEVPEAEKAEKDAKKKKTYVVVKYKDTEQPAETYALAENKVVGMAAERTLQGQKQLVQYSFVYEDKGKELKIKEVLLTSKMTIPAGALPGAEPDPKHPEGEKKEGEKKEGEGEEPPADEEGGIDMSVKLTEFATVGKAEICTKLEVTIDVKAGPMQLSIPASLVITNPKGNKDVSDDDLKPLDNAPKADGTGGGSEDEGF